MYTYTVTEKCGVPLATSDRRPSGGHSKEDNVQQKKQIHANHLAQFHILLEGNF